MNSHRRRRAWLLCLLPVALTGCSTTMGSRFAATPPQQPKSIAVVGDRPVSVASGEPGTRVVTNADPEPRPNPRGRISGRVFDEQGSPVANATVRLADGGAKGGKDIRGTTDKTGSFTLNGLRPGSTYSLVAEDEEGTLTGQVTAKTSDRVEIALVSDEAATRSTSRKAARPASRVRPISNQESVGDEAMEPLRPVVNREDIAPPAESAETLDPGPPPPGGSDSGRPQLMPPQSGRWQNTKTASKPRNNGGDPDAVATSSENPPRRSRVVSSGDDDDEGPNPLPPAIETDRDDPPPSRPTSRVKPSSSSRTRAPVKSNDSGDLSLAPETSAVDKPQQRLPMTTGSPEEAVVTADPATAVPASLALNESMPTLLPDPVDLVRSDPNGTIPPPTGSGPPDLPPVGAGGGLPALAAAPPGLPPAPTTTTQDVLPQSPASEPVFSSQEPAKPTAPAEYNPFALVAAPAAAATATVLEKVPDRSKVTALEPTDNSNLASTVPTGPKTKWGDLANTELQPKVKVEPTKATLASSFVKRFRPSVVPEKVDASVATCSYDTKLRKIKDFRLPDLSGKPVRFQDLDADYVLLDFWGTWCSPCLDSIPHLVELQKKYGPNRLKVVGIACEEAPVEQRRAKVEEAARRLGINYPILLSSMDGKPCPVQQALAVQAMPTMILLDRKGQVIWRSTGATQANESRLDRVLASQMTWSETARR